MSSSDDPVELPSAQDSSSGGPTVSPSIEPTTSSNSPSQEPTTPPPTTEPPTTSSTTTEQSTTTQEPPSSTTTTPPVSSTTTTSASPTTTSNLPPSSIQSSATPTTTLSQAPPSQSTSTIFVPPSSSSQASPTTIPTQIVTTDSAGRSITTSASLVVTTDPNGNVFTVTHFVPTTHAPGTESSHGASNFFDNTGAVAGVFVVIGLVVTAIIVTFTFIMLRRRRRQRLDRDVAAAAAAAAAASHSRFDEEDDQPSMTQYGGYYTATNSGHSVDQQGNLHHGYDYEDPSGGYDPYAAHLVDVPPNGDRSSTATGAGLAGFGAAAATTNYYNGHPQQSRDVDYSQGDYGHTYGDPQYDVAHQYAAPLQGLAPVAEMSAEGHSDHQHQQQNYYNSYNYTDDPYEGYAAPGGALPRQDSSGSVGSHGAHHGGRDLTVTNA
ncbi:hypothetical protein VHUM_03698 [Vanrija humicola]|uniref:Mid2 domain-containing protein n=1 Tax=Vanrija humicola TaxID=5417 RepID=A0A7D8UWH9_VANHU|nr:hypothetical protein VHUM_03698 [Vanrija humicola]